MATIPAKPTVYEGFNASRWVGAKMLAANGTAAGVHKVEIEVPAGAILLNVGVIGVTLWNQGTSSTLIVGDGDDDNGFIVATDLQATDLLAGEAILVGAGTALAGGKVGAYIANSQWAVGGGSTSGIYRTTSRVITFKNTTVGTAATAGETICLVNYLTFSGSEPIVVGSYVAS